MFHVKQNSEKNKNVSRETIKRNIKRSVSRETIYGIFRKNIRKFKKLLKCFEKMAK